VSAHAPRTSTIRRSRSSRATYRVASDVQRAVDGTQVVVSAVHGFAGPGGVSPASIDRDGNRNLIDAAVRSHATIILMSVVGAAS
jgi:hypothetical protein